MPCPPRKCRQSRWMRGHRLLAWRFSHTRSRQVNTLLLQQIEHFQDSLQMAKEHLCGSKAQMKSTGSDREVGCRKWGSVPGESRPVAPAAAENNKQMLFENYDLHLSVGRTRLVPCSAFLIDNDGMKAFGVGVFLRKENVLGKVYRTLAHELVSS